MPSRKLRSRSKRRVYVRTPGGRTVIHYRSKKPKIAHCGVCRARLQGVIRELPSKMRNTTKSKKRPERPYGGVLCSKCLRNLLKDRIRK